MQSEATETVERPKCGQHKVKFTFEDDQRLSKYVAMVGEGDWGKIAQMMGDRNGRQCRERWNNYLNPVLRKEAWTTDEVNLLIEKYRELGPRWNKISKFFNNRSTNNVKNKWMTLKRREEKGHAPTLHKAPQQLPVPDIKAPCPLVIPQIRQERTELPPKPIRIPLPPLLPMIADIDRFLKFDFPKLPTQLRI